MLSSLCDQTALGEAGQLLPGVGGWAAGGSGRHPSQDPAAQAPAHPVACVVHRTNVQGRTVIIGKAPETS